MTRPTISTTWSSRPNIQNDLGYILDNTWTNTIINDNSWNRILVHTWTFEDQDTRYFAREEISTSWT